MSINKNKLAIIIHKMQEYLGATPKLKKLSMIGSLLLKNLMVS